MATDEQLDFLYSEIDGVLSAGEFYIINDFLNWWTAKVKSATDEQFDAVLKVKEALEYFGVRLVEGECTEENMTWEVQMPDPKEEERWKDAQFGPGG